MSGWRFQRPHGLPLPQPSAEAQPFFDALRERRLVVQRCASCGVLAHPPRALCPACHDAAFEWVAVSGRGEVYSYVVTHQAVHPAFADHTPLATVEVALAEGPRMVSNLVDVPPEQVAIGLPVEVVFKEVAPEVVLPLFRRRNALPGASAG